MRDSVHIINKSLLVLLGVVLVGCQTFIEPELIAQENNVVGLIYADERAYDGFTLFAPLRSDNTYLINNNGEIVHTWADNISPGNSVYLLEDGSLLKAYSDRSAAGGRFDAGGSGGGVRRLSWEGDILWDFPYASTQHLQHHDIELLPNGNVLLIAWELRSEAESIDAGRNPNLLADNELWPDTIVEVNPIADEIVWKWDSWDHLVQDFDSSQDNFGVVADHPELIDINFANAMGGADWLHINAVDYNEELDQIIMSNHNFNEIWIIDHSTTTAEAASHSGGNSGKGGDLLYRWGNPQTYDAGNAGDQELYGQHDAQWIVDGLPGAGNILVFNNGNQRLRPYTTINEITTPVLSDGSYELSGSSFGPTASLSVYEANPNTEFYATNISGAQRLPNGNTLICDGPAGRFFEVTTSGEIVWDYINPVVADQVLSNEEASAQQNFQNIVFRATRYSPDYAAFEGRGL